MSGTAGLVTKMPSENLRQEFLDMTTTLNGDTIAGVQSVTLSPSDGNLTIPRNVVNTAGTGITFFLSGGVLDVLYTALVTILTAGGQTLTVNFPILIIPYNPAQTA